MKTYATKYKIFSEPIPLCEFEVLNELKDLSNRTDENCLTHTRFLFEMDKIPLIDQFSNVPSISPYCKRIVFSGSKSLHHVIEFDPKYEEQCRILYKEIWKVLNSVLFNGNADPACSNPARLTRRPNAIRDNGKLQKLLFIGELLSDDISKKVIRKAKSNYIAERIKSQNVQKIGHISTIHNGLCAKYDVVTRYLNKAFPNITGNGVSSKWLFAAIACCIKYNDMDTLERIKAKAIREHWTMKELERIETNVNKNKER